MGFVDTFREMYPGKIKYTFWDIRDKSRKENKGWRLDYTMCSRDIYHIVKDSDIHNDFWGSDHCPVSTTIDADKINIEEFVEMQKKYADKRDMDGDDNDLSDDERKSDLDMEDNLGEAHSDGKDEMEFEAS